MVSPRHTAPIVGLIVALCLMSHASPMVNDPAASPVASVLQSHSAPVAPLAPLVRQRSSLGWNDTKCMALFETNRGAFNRCKEENNTCWLFLQEPPYIILDRKMKTAEQQIPFPCASPPAEFRGLRGAAFRIMQQTPAADATCAWAGSECGFNNLVRFVQNQSEVNPDYKFAITGLLLEKSERLSRYILPGVSLMQEEMVIIGPRRTPRESPFPLGRMVKPFEDAAWGIFTVVVLLIMMYSVMLAVIFGPRPVTLPDLFYFYLGEFSEAEIAASTKPPVNVSETELSSTGAGAAISGALAKLASFAGALQPSTPPSPTESLSVTGGSSSEEALHHAYVNRVVSKIASYRVCVRLLAMSMGALVLIFLIFYEMSVVNALFEQRSQPLQQSIDKLSDIELSTFSVQKDAATEDVFRLRVDPSGKRFKNKEVPWGRCTTEGECFEWMLNKAHKVKYFVGFKTIGTYEIVSRDVCSNLTIFETENRLYTFGAGWLFGNSSTTDPKYRRDIDKAILHLQFSDALRKEVHDSVGKLDTSKCSSRIDHIDIGVIGVAVFFFVAPFLVMSSVLVFWQCCGVSRMFARLRRRRTRFGLSMTRREVDQFCRMNREKEDEEFLIGQGTAGSTSD